MRQNVAPHQNEAIIKIACCENRVKILNGFNGPEQYYSGPINDVGLLAIDLPKLPIYEYLTRQLLLIFRFSD